MRFEFACGGLAALPSEGEHRSLDVQGPARNINLRIEDISKALVSDIPDVLLDLLEVAAYIYCADQQTRRGSEYLTDYGSDWRREMAFRIPVRSPGLWQSAEVSEGLADLLGFLSDDHYTFKFVAAQNPLAGKEAYFSNLTDQADQPDEIALFSGGLDSFAGAIEAHAMGKKMVLVGHHAAPKIFSIQKQLVGALNQRFAGPRLLFIPVNITNTGSDPVEYTQRTRSFLFAALGRPRNVWLPADAKATSPIHDFARSAVKAGLAVFVVPGTVAEAGQAGASDVQQMQTILVDLDQGDIGAKRDHLARSLGEPSLEIASGGMTAEGQRKLHLYWRLSEAVASDDIAVLCRTRRLLALKVGGDPAFGSAHQPIRVAGTIHNKSGTPRLVEILHQRDRDFHLADLVDAVEAMPPLDGLALPEPGPGKHATGGNATALFGKRIREGGADETTRFEALSRIIGYWVRRCRDGHVTADQAWNEMVDFNLAQIDPPWPEDRLRREASKIWKLDRNRRGDDGPSAADALRDAPDGSVQSAIPSALSEDALAEEFSRIHGHHWRYVAAWGQWLTWTGTVWRRESTLLAYDLARGVCRTAAGGAEPKVRAKISSASTIAAVERIARADRRHAEGTEVWDRDPWVLNTPAGLVELRGGQTGPHDPTLAMTKITSASPQGSCTIWREFLATVTGGDLELQSYLQRMAGYCLTGVTTEHALFFLYGTGANGKSVFANTLTTLLGDYAAVAAMDMFMASHGDRHPTDMAGLRGARVVTAIETEQGSRWAESKLKALTGGDKITARFMRQDFFEFIPQFKLLIVGNHKPSIRNVDEAMRRRLHMVPFTITIPPAKRDKTLPERLLAERDGILAWALEGCLQWQRIGLQPPAAVMAATDEYFEAEDAIGRWIEERCDLGNQFTEASNALFADWKLWAENNGEYAGSNKRFAETLIGRGLERWRSSQAKGFRGIALRAHPTSTSTEF